MTIVLNAKIKNRRDSAAVWASKNPFLKPGEICIEEDTDRIKRGPGYWNDLDYYVNATTVAGMIQEAIDSLSPGDSGDIGELVAELADDGHPDGIVDGVALDVLYENRKV